MDRRKPIDFRRFKKFVSEHSLLAKTEVGDVLSPYLIVSSGALSAVLVKKEAKVQKSIYYASNVLHEIELNHSIVEKFVLAMIIAS